MVTALSTTSRTALTQLAQPACRALMLPFMAPLLPTTSLSLRHRKIALEQTRMMRNWPVWPVVIQPVCLRPEVTHVVLPNFNFNMEKVSLMQTSLGVFKTTKWNRLHIERGAVICDKEWIEELLTHLSKKGVRELGVIAKAKSFSRPGITELIKPTANSVAKAGGLFQHSDQRPEIYKIDQIKLTNGMIEALSEMISSSSHSVSFDLVIR